MAPVDPSPQLLGYLSVRHEHKHYDTKLSVGLLIGGMVIANGISLAISVKAAVGWIDALTLFALVLLAYFIYE